MVDLRRIAHPLVIFACYRDNITPAAPGTGLDTGWSMTTEALKRAGQRIVYLTHPRTSHLGIFVSASVARLEHRAILESLEEIEALAPGLYEMKIENPSGDPNCRELQYRVRFEPSTVEELRSGYPRESFERVRQMSEHNDTLYRAFGSRWGAGVIEPMDGRVAEVASPDAVQSLSAVGSIQSLDA